MRYRKALAEEVRINSGHRRVWRGAVVLVATCLLALICLAAVPPAVYEVADGPRLLRTSPAGGEGLGRDTTVVLSFDRPMDTESLERAARFEPPLDFTVSGEAECMVVPENLLSPNAAYVFRLRPGLAKDLEGRAFQGEVEIYFTTRGDGVTIEIPAFSFHGEILEGKDPQGVASVISFGVGHYPGTGRPGRGNFVIMAHASGQIDFPFNALFDLGEGDEIELTYGGREYRYRWSEGIVVPDTDMWIIEPTSNPVLTAFVCCAENGKPSPTFHPPYRYVVRASLNGVSP
jgi:hypothetical protein